MFKRLFDFSAEKSIDEAFCFYFVSFIMAYYIIISGGLLLWHIPDIHNSVGIKIIFIILLMQTPIPFIFCAPLSLVILFKKRITNSETLVYTALALIFVGILPTIFGVGFGLICPTLLSLKGDEHVDVLDAIQKKEFMRHQLMLEKQLCKDKAATLKRAEFKKILEKEYSS